MIPLKLKIKDAEDINCTLPTSWKDVTMKQFIQLYKHREDIDKHPELELVVYTGVDQHIWNALTLDQIALVYDKLKYLEADEVDFPSLPVPDKITIGEQEVEVPKQFGKKAWGAIKGIVAERNANKGADNEIIPLAIAFMMYDDYSNEKFDEDKARELIPLIEEMPCTVAYPVGSFFFLLLKHWRRNGQKSSTKNQKQSISLQVLTA